MSEVCGGGREHERLGFDADCRSQCGGLWGLELAVVFGKGSVETRACGLGRQATIGFRAQGACPQVSYFMGPGQPQATI